MAFLGVKKRYWKWALYAGVGYFAFTKLTGGATAGLGALRRLRIRAFPAGGASSMSLNPTVATPTQVPAPTEQPIVLAQQLAVTPRFTV